MSAAVCLLHTDLNEFRTFLLKAGERDVTRVANNCILYLCLLDNPLNRDLIQNNTFLNPEAHISVHRIYTRYLSEVISPVSDDSPDELLIDDRTERLWVQQIEVLIGLPENLQSSIRLTSANWRAYPDYTYFRTKGGI